MALRGGTVPAKGRYSQYLPLVARSNPQTKPLLRRASAPLFRVVGSRGGRVFDTHRNDADGLRSAAQRDDAVLADGGETNFCASGGQTADSPTLKHRIKV